MVPMVPLFPAAMTGSEAAEAILIVLVGCAITVFNKQFVQDTLEARRRRSARTQAAWEEPYSRIVAVVIGSGFVLMGGAMLLGYG